MVSTDFKTGRTYYIGNVSDYLIEGYPVKFIKMVDEEIALVKLLSGAEFEISIKNLSKNYAKKRDFDFGKIYVVKEKYWHEPYTDVQFKVSAGTPLIYVKRENDYIVLCKNSEGETIPICQDYLSVYPISEYPTKAEIFISKVHGYFFYKHNKFQIKHHKKDRKYIYTDFGNYGTEIFNQSRYNSHIVDIAMCHKYCQSELKNIFCTTKFAIKDKEGNLVDIAFSSDTGIISSEPLDEGSYIIKEI